MSTVPPNRTKPKRSGASKALLTTLIGLLVLALAGFGGYQWYVRQKIDKKVQHSALMPTNEANQLVVPQDENGNLIDPSGTVLQDDQGQPIDASTMHIDDHDRVADEENRPMLVTGNKALPELQQGQPGEYLMGVKSNAVSQPTKVASAGNSLNFLIVGTDKAQGGTARSDVMVVAHISGDRKRVDLIHVPRDLYVSIPGQGKNKINAAYATGGTPLLVQTLQPLLGVPIDHVGQVDFDGFQEVTDALGGVWLPVDGQRVRMNGKEALKWVRERKTLNQGDISRGQRQMQFIRAVMMEYLSQGGSSGAGKIDKVIEVGLANMVVDDGLTAEELRKLAMSLGDVNGERLKMWTAPWTSAGPGPHGMSIVNMSEPQMKVLSEHLKKDTMASYSDPVSPKSGFGG